MKKTWKLRHFILAQIACTVVIYLIMSFIVSDINSSHWSIFQRILVPVLGFIATMAILIWREPTT